MSVILTKEDVIRLFKTVNSDHPERIEFWVNYCLEKFSCYENIVSDESRVIIAFHNGDYVSNRVVISSMFVRFYKDRNLHRLDGPAEIGLLYNPSTSWFFNDKRMCQKNDQTRGDPGHYFGELAIWAKNNNIDLDNLSEEDKVMIKLVWG